jgi:hypothetical protein
MGMISDEKIVELGSALADINQCYTAEYIRKILDYALEHRRMLGYPHDIADMLEDFAKRLREFDWIRSGTGKPKQNKGQGGGHSADFVMIVRLAKMA